MLGFFRDGGPFMYPLALWSTMALGLFLERLWTYWRLRSEEELAELTQEITRRIQSGTSLDQLREYTRAAGKLEGEVFSEGISRFGHLSREQRTVEEMRAEMNGTVERAAQIYLERYCPVLQFVATSSVLLGLLGTVSGMIHAFEGIAEKGLGEPTVVAAGISEALITTVAGLVIAIPTLAVYSYIMVRADGKGILFEAYGHGMVDALLSRWRASQAA